MAKKPTEKLEEVEVTLLQKIGPERFNVVSGVVRGPLQVTKTLERNVSLVVARGTARKSIDIQTTAVKAKLGLPVES